MRVRGALAAFGFLLLLALVAAGTLGFTGDYPVAQRAIVCLCVLGAGATTFGIFLFLRHALQRLESLRDILSDVGVLICGLLTVVALYGTAYTILGVSYTVDIFRETDVTIIPLRHDVLTCAYFSTVTLSTLGYGDFQPGQAARGIAALESLNGYMILGLLVSYIFKLLEVRVAPRAGR